MEQLYAHHGLSLDQDRARRAIAGLFAEPQQGDVWMIDADGTAVGYMVLTVGYSLEFHGRYGLLDEISIDEAWRGKGFGTQALEFAAEWCRERGLRALRLEVSHDNLGALRLYQRAGFDVHDRHLMTKWI